MKLAVSKTDHIETPRLLLRGFRTDDIPDMLHNWIADPTVQGGYGEPVYTTPEAACSLLEVWAESWRWAVILKDTGQNIGQVGFYCIHETQRVGELEYCIGAAFQGKGFATEAVRAMIDFTLLRTDIISIEAWHRAENPGSGRVLEKAGLRRGAAILNPPHADRFPGAVCYSLSKQ